MKTVEQIVDAISMHGCRSDWIDALHEYGAQVAERVTERDCRAVCAGCNDCMPFHPVKTIFHYRGLWLECHALSIRAAQAKECFCEMNTPEKNIEYDCKTHGRWDARRESGCPSCVGDMREEIEKLKAEKLAEARG